MKIGKLEFKSYAAKKPVALAPDGSFLTAADALSAPALSLDSRQGLTAELQAKLTLERYALEPDFKALFFGDGVYTKKQLMEHVKLGSEIGVKVMGAEMNYCNHLVASLRKAPEAFPKLPRPPVQPERPWKPAGRWVVMRLQTRALFCENTTDPVTGPFAQYRIAHVHPAFAARGFRVAKLDGMDDVRANFVPNARNNLTVYLSGVGHGAYPLYTGHAGDRILEVGKYDPAEVSGKSIHFLSCQTAGQLGPDTCAKGARSYGGYTENFILTWDNPSTPVNEFELFASCDSTWDLQLAAGATAEQARAATVQAFNAAAALVPNTAAASYLIWDRDHLKLCGDPAARIMPYRLVRVRVPFESPALQDALAEAGELVE